MRPRPATTRAATAAGCATTLHTVAGTGGTPGAGPVAGPAAAPTTGRTPLDPHHFGTLSRPTGGPPGSPVPACPASVSETRSVARGERATTRSALLRFGLASLLVALVVGAVGAAAGRRAAREQSIDNARRVTQVLATSVVAPNVSPGLRTGDPAAVSQLDAVVRGHVTGGSLVRVKIWTPDGRI